MITKAQAMEAREFHYGNCTRAIGKRGGVQERSVVYRRNGQTQTWKRDQERYRVPIKRGLYEYADITPDRANEWHVPEDCPLRFAESGQAVEGIAHHVRVQPVTVPILGDRQFWRGVCTCGFHGMEHLVQLAAQMDLAKHIAQVIPELAQGEA